MKTVPKYVVSIVVKDLIGEWQAKQNNEIINNGGTIPYATQSAIKSIVAGISGAILTNPADVIRNEMFKDDKATLLSTLKKLCNEGVGDIVNKRRTWKWMWRGVDKNLVAVAAPISLTIFLTDVFERSWVGADIKKRMTKIKEEKN